MHRMTLRRTSLTNVCASVRELVRRNDVSRLQSTAAWTTGLRFLSMNNSNVSPNKVLYFKEKNRDRYEDRCADRLNRLIGNCPRKSDEIYLEKKTKPRRREYASGAWRKAR